MKYSIVIVILTAVLTIRLGHAADASDFKAIGGSVLDKRGFAQWMDGKEMPVTQSAAKGGPLAVVWSPNSKPDWQGVKFGEGLARGVRHLRIGFTEELAMGSVLVRGGGVLSVLKMGAAYPGDLQNDSQWTPAERVANGQVSRNAVDNEGYALWSLPPGTKTRALRFSHAPAPGDPEMAGWLGGVWLLEQRLANVAPQAVAQSAARDDVSAKLIDESNNRQWQTWDNGEKGAALPISSERPEFITLSWPRAVSLSG